MAFSPLWKAPQGQTRADEAPPSLGEQRAEIVAEASEAQAPRTGFFDRMRQAVTRTRDSFAQSLNSVIALTREVDQSTLDSLEPLLLAADVGSATASIVLENLRQRALRKGIESGAELKTLLKLELQHVLDRVVTPINHPGARPRSDHDGLRVNGTGKTTTSGKLAAHFNRTAQVGAALCRRHLPRGRDRAARSLGPAKRSAPYQNQAGRRPLGRPLRCMHRIESARRPTCSWSIPPAACTPKPI